jgi:hypothetical protein
LLNKGRGVVTRKLKVVIPRTEKDLEELRRLDKAGKLASGSSYPTAGQLAGRESVPVEKKQRRR